MAKEVMVKSAMANDMKYVDSVGVPGGKDVAITDQPKAGNSGLTLTIVIIVCVILGIVSGIFFAKRSALK